MARNALCRTAFGRFKAFLGALALGAVCALPGVAAETARTVRVGIESSAEPISFLLPDGRPTGFAVDLFQAVAREAGLTPVPIVGSWEEIFDRFKAGEIDVLASLAYTRDRDEFIDFTVRHLSMRGSVFVRRDDRAIRVPGDLAHVRVGVQRQSFFEEYLRARGWDRHVVPVRDFHDALRAVDEGRCDAVAAIGLIGNHVIRTAGLRNVRASEVELPDYAFNLHMGVRAGDAARLAELNDGLARVRENGTYDRLFERWLGPLEPRELRLMDLRPVLAPLLIIAVAVAFALAWQRRMLRRMAEQTAKLRLSETRLRLVLEGSEDGFWDWDLRTNRIERSERWASMLGYTLAEIAPTIEAGAALLHPDDRPSYLAWEERLKTPAADRIDIECRMRAKSGEWRWILDRGKVVERDAAGRALRMAGTHTDITDRKRTEAALIESQALLKRSAQLLDQSQRAARVGGWETDLRTGRVYWTAETYRIHETTPEEFSPTREAIYAFYPPESRQRLAAAAARAIAEGSSFSLELELHTARNRRIHVHTTGVAEREDGVVVRLHGSFRDITAEKTAEQERETLRLKMLEAQKLESLGVLAGGIAHDFNNLLTAILANASLARATGHAPAERLGQIEAAARRAADLCRQMLSYAGKGSFVIEVIDLGALINETLQLIQVSISKKAVLTIDLAPDLVPVEGDVSQLRQVVMNLVINASEALGDQPGEIRIGARSERPDLAASQVGHSFDLPAGDCVCLQVTDTGHGMAPATLARIFDPFFTTKFAGRGLGLAAVLGIVRSHHGALTVDSTPGAGSTFRLYLPGSAKHPPPREREREPDARGAIGTASGTVLIADDEPSVLEAAEIALRHHGYTTVAARDGHDAVRAFRASPRRFSAVLLDLTMPGLDGVEALRAVRAIDPRMPVLIMSGFSEQDVFQRLRGFDGVPIVRKPFTHDTLLRQVAGVAR